MDEDEKKIGEEKIRFGMKDASGRMHFFCVRCIEQIPEFDVDEIYPAEQFSCADKDRAAYCFRSFGYPVHRKKNCYSKKLR